MADTWTMAAAPAALASRATSPAPKTCTVSNRWRPLSEQNADEVDHRVGASHCGGHELGVAQVRLHGMDLPDAAQRLQMTGEVRPAAGHAHAPAALGERADHVASEKTAAAEDHGEPTLGNLRLCHGTYPIVRAPPGAIVPAPPVVGLSIIKPPAPVQTAKRRGLRAQRGAGRARRVMGAQRIDTPGRPV